MFEGRQKETIKIRNDFTKSPASQIILSGPQKYLKQGAYIHIHTNTDGWHLGSCSEFYFICNMISAVSKKMLPRQRILFSVILLPKKEIYTQLWSPKENARLCGIHLGPCGWNTVANEVLGKRRGKKRQCSEAEQWDCARAWLQERISGKSHLKPQNRQKLSTFSPSVSKRTNSPLKQR